MLDLKRGGKLLKVKDYRFLIGVKQNIEYSFFFRKKHRTNRERQVMQLNSVEVGEVERLRRQNKK